MPPKKPRPADTGGVPKPVRTGTLTGETPVKEHIKKIEKNGGKEAPKPTEEKKSKEKGSRKQPVKAHRRMPTLQEGVEEKDWDWDTPKKHSTPKGENVRKEGMEEAGMGDTAKIKILPKASVQAIKAQSQSPQSPSCVATCFLCCIIPARADKVSSFLHHASLTADFQNTCHLFYIVIYPSHILMSLCPRVLISS